MVQLCTLALVTGCIYSVQCDLKHPHEKKYPHKSEQKVNTLHTEHRRVSDFHKQRWRWFLLLRKTRTVFNDVSTRGILVDCLDMSYRVSYVVCRIVYATGQADLYRMHYGLSCRFQPKALIIFSCKPCNPCYMLFVFLVMWFIT